MAHRHMAHGSCVLRHVMDTPVTAPHRACVDVQWRVGAVSHGIV